MGGGGRGEQELFSIICGRVCNRERLSRAAAADFQLPSAVYLHVSERSDAAAGSPNKNMDVGRWLAFYVRHQGPEVAFRRSALPNTFIIGYVLILSRA